MFLYQDILREFNKKKVKYVLVGGMAYNFLGGSRGTMDMDILLELSNSNLRKTVSILKRKGYKVKQPVDPMTLLDGKTRKDLIENKNMKALNFFNYKSELKEIDIIIDSPISYEEAYKNSKNIKVKSFSVRVISIDDLIKMKKASKRGLDAIDVDDLKIIKRGK